MRIQDARVTTIAGVPTHMSAVVGVMGGQCLITITGIESGIGIGIGSGIEIEVEIGSGSGIAIGTVIVTVPGIEIGILAGAGTFHLRRGSETLRKNGFPLPMLPEAQKLYP